jgi:uncharacterized protein
LSRQSKIEKPRLANDAGHQAAARKRASHDRASRARSGRSHVVSLFDPISFLIISAGVFAGAVVSGLMGFAFSAVAGAISLHVLPPTEAVPLMMACSIVTQAVSLIALRGTVQWRGNPLLIAGGVLGMLPALYLLQHIDAGIFRIGFGMFLVAYAGYMLMRPVAACAPDAGGQLRDAVVGFGGGLVGGLTAMPGALPTIWCDYRGMPKNQSRGLVQPYITTMQVLAVAVMLMHQSMTAQALINVAYSLPSLAAGAALGVVMFRRVNDAMFRSVVLVVLIVAGTLLVV